MNEPDFDAAEQHFFAEGDAMESGELPLEELTDRRPRLSGAGRAWS